MKTKTKIVIICAMLTAVLLVPAILLIFAFALPPQYDSSFYGGMKIKYERLKSVDGNKIVVIGGSSVAFGLRSDIMETELGMPTVNFGLYANLGTKYMLDIAEDHISDGDIVIIAPEQNAQALSLYFNGEAVWDSVDGCYSILGDIDSKNIGDMAKSFLSFVSGKFKFWSSGEKPDPNGVYNVRSFDEYGDIVYEREYNIMQDGYDTGMPISYARTLITDEFIDYINNYRNRLAGKGATVLFSFCPMNVAAYGADASAADQKLYYDSLSERLDMPILGSPSSHGLDSDWFYDSNFHLNSAGAEYYTLLLAQELKAELGDFSPIKTPTPVMPKAPSGGGISDGIDDEALTAAAEIFDLGGVEVVSEDGKVMYRGSFRIDGLTEYGKTLSELTVPDTLLGLPVTSISDECFANNENLVKITFGKNISSVGKGAFKNCVNLNGVYITSLDPSVYRPSSDVFDGLPHAVFYVPREVYATEYLIDYFWGFFGTERLKSY